MLNKCMHIHIKNQNMSYIAGLSCVVLFIALTITDKIYPNTPISAANQSAKLSFASEEGGGYVFNTGILRGRLQSEGKSLGLSSFIHLPSATRLDGRFGILSFYRIFSANMRYGSAVWDWPSESKLLPDGAVQIHWLAEKDRPFEMTTIYRWKDESTLDLETIVKPQKDLQRFEVFLASYFHENFPASCVYVSENPQTEGKPGFLVAKKSFGDWQMFPRDARVLQTIHDGRWQKEPNPVEWVIMPDLAAPIGLRREKEKGLTVILMAPSEDCFAIATPYEGDSHCSLYLSLFGRDIRAGEIARAHSRLIVAPASLDQKILDLYRAYISEVRSGAVFMGEGNNADKATLTKELWSESRILDAIKAIEKQHKDGLLSDKSYQMRINMLKTRLAGKYVSESLSVTDPPLNFIQNAGFEKVNKNSEKDRSRWLWWGGWSWGGDYENYWETRPEYVHSGKFSARIQCIGSQGRIGIFTPELPAVSGAKEYKLTFWAKGEGENMLFVNFEIGARGELREKIGPAWKQYTVIGEPEAEAKTYGVYFYHIGKGTIWLDDMELVPVGGKLD